MRRKSTAAAAIAFVAACLCCHAQVTFREVRSSPQTYVWAEGWGRSVQEADIQALSSLCSAVSISVTSTYSLTETDRKTPSGCTGESIIRNTVTAFSCATLEGAGIEILSKGKRAHVARWIGRDEVARIISARECRVKDLLEEAMSAEISGRTGAELDCLCEAAGLIATIPGADELTMSINGAGMVRPVTWIPSKISEMIDGIRVEVLSREGDMVCLAFRSGGLYACGLDFRFFDGRVWSPIRHSTDGRAKVELSPGALGEHIQVMIGGTASPMAFKIAEKR